MPGSAIRPRARWTPGHERARQLSGAGARPLICALALVTLLVSVSSSTAGSEGAPADPVTPDVLRQVLGDGGLARTQALDVDALGRFYDRRGFAPAWSADDGGAERASALLGALATAEAHGLDPGDYHLDAIRIRGAEPGARAAAERDVLLSDALVRYATHLRAGRLRPERVELDWEIDAPRFDAVPRLVGALDDLQAFRTVLASLPPPAPGYARLVEALWRYRAIAARGGWPRVASGPLLRPGRLDARLPELRRRLVAEGEPVVRSSGPGYDGALEASVRRWQARHGLVVDGIVGPATLAALNVPVSDRVRQIGLNLERWRWLPRDLGPRYIAVNAADATLEVVAEGQTLLASRVVVGDPRHPTPVLQARIDAVVFNPPWDVPASIAVEEMLPRLRRDPRYLAENDIAIVRGADPFGLAIDWSAVSPEAFPFRLRQQPGPRNPLGRIKFDMPNPSDVSLHDTPGRALFARPVRTSSHGCVRVERAHELAAYLLAGPATPWTPRTIAEVIAAGNTRRVPVPQPLAVYLLYWTAFVDSDGVVHFRDDVYGRDRRLAAALDRGGEGVRPAGAGVSPGCSATEDRARG